MKQIASSTSAAAKPEKQKSTWRGYSMEQLQFERALTLTRIAIEKERMGYESQRVRSGNFWLSPSVFGRLVNAIGYADFLVLGVKLWRRVAPLFSKKR